MTEPPPEPDDATRPASPEDEPAREPSIWLKSPPERIGPYHIQRVIAAGGMGVVYEAMQENPRRPVALKLMKPGITSPSAQRRFEFEAQLLARLHHPGIAQIYEAGSYEDGEISTPFFAMEYIPGALPLTEYADRKKLGVRERLELFQAACDAVHHGHQKGIIHRDLKPDNVLVDSRGRVKVIDFGVARSTDSDMALTEMQTSVGQLIGTLQYMSPEQINGDPRDIDTRSDVYSLAVILYELLCGDVPYDVRKSSLVEATRVIQERDPTRPSTVDRKLRGDVETILLKALEKDRDRRYQSAHGLGQDLGRFLRGEPIVARAPSLTYQIRIFARRNRPALVGLLGVFLTLVAGIIVSTTLYLRAERAREVADAQRDRALQAEERARVINAFLLDDLLGAADPDAAQGRDVTVKEVLETATRRVGVTLSDRPAVEVPLRVTLGELHLTLGNGEEAQEQVERALEVARREFGEDDPRTLDARSVKAGLLLETGGHEEAAAIYRDVLERQRRLLGDRDPTTLQASNDLGLALYLVGELDEAERLLERTLAERRALFGEESEPVVETMTNLAGLQVSRWESTGTVQDGETAVRQFRETLALAERTLGDRHSATIILMNNLAVLLGQLGREQEALPLTERMVELDRIVYGEDHPWTLIGMHSHAVQLQSAGRRDEAVEYFRIAVEGWQRHTQDPRRFTTIAKFSELMIPWGRGAEAEAILARELPMAEELLGPNHSLTMLVVVDLGWAIRAQGRLADAEPYYRRTYEGRKRSMGPGHQYTLRAKAQLGGVVAQLGRHGEGIRIAEQALEEGQAALPEDHYQFATIREYLALALLEAGRTAEAEKHLRVALELRRKRSSPPQLAECESLLGAALTRTGRYDEAESLLTSAWPVLVETRGEGYYTRTATRDRIVDLCERRGEPGRAKELLRVPEGT